MIRGDNIPFDGVLVPDANYIQFEKDSESLELCEATLKEGYEKQWIESWWVPILTGIAGAYVGSALLK